MSYMSKGFCLTRNSITYGRNMHGKLCNVVNKKMAMKGAGDKTSFTFASKFLNVYLRTTWHRLYARQH
jgi:hypothetical protein